MNERQNYYFLGNEQEIKREHKHEEKAEKAGKKEMRRKKLHFYSMLFRAAAVLVLILALACAIIFGYTDTSRLTNSLTIVTERVFELWRAVLFSFVGLSSGGCLWGISTVFEVLEKY